MLLPRGWDALQDLRALGESQELRQRIQGKKVLLISVAGARPAPDLVPVSIFLPTAATVYWVDNPRYAGLTVASRDLSALIHAAPVDYLVIGPVRRLTASRPGAGEGVGYIGRLRASVRSQSLADQFREVRFCERFITPLPEPTRPVLRIGDWTLAKPLPTASVAP